MYKEIDVYIESRYARKLICKDLGSMFWLLDKYKTENEAAKEER